jgi:hypothetical protein
MDGWDENPPHTKKILIAWGDHQGIGHASTSHAQCVIERMGYESGTYDTFILSDSAMIRYGNPSVQGAAGQGLLDIADAIFFIGQRNIVLSDQQKVDLIKFIRNGGGFIASHQVRTTLYIGFASLLMLFQSCR